MAEIFLLFVMVWIRLGGLTLLATEFVVGFDDCIAEIPRKSAAPLPAGQITNHALGTRQLFSQLNLRESGLQQVFDHLLPVHFFILKKCSLLPAMDGGSHLKHKI